MFIVFYLTGGHSGDHPLYLSILGDTVATTISSLRLLGYTVANMLSNLPYWGNSGDHSLVYLNGGYNGDNSVSTAVKK